MVSISKWERCDVRQGWAAVFSSFSSGSLIFVFKKYIHCFFSLFAVLEGYIISNCFFFYNPLSFIAERRDTKTSRKKSRSPRRRSRSRSPGRRSRSPRRKRSPPRVRYSVSITKFNLMRYVACLWEFSNGSLFSSFQSDRPASLKHRSLFMLWFVF